MFARLLDPENEHDYVWADSAYSGECFDALLSLGGFESLIHEKDARNHPLSDAAKELIRLKSSIANIMYCCSAASLTAFLCPQDFPFVLIIRGALEQARGACMPT